MLHGKPDIGTLLGLAPLARQHPRAAGLVGWWMLGEGAGDLIYDLSGYGGHGTLTDVTPAAAWTHGQFGTTLNLPNNTLDAGVLVEEALLPQLVFEAGQSFSVMARLATSQAQLTDVWPMIVANDISAVSAWNMILHEAQHSAPWIFEIYNAAGTRLPISGLSDIADGLHHVLIGGRLPDGTLFGYQDGVSLGTASGTTDAMPQRPLGIHRLPYEGNVANVGGHAIEVRIYNRDITQTEALSLYDEPLLEWEWALRRPLRRVRPTAFAPQHDAASESHTGTTGSASEASFTWNHTPVGTPKGVLVFTFVNANADNATGVTYDGVALTAVTSGRAVDTATEAGDCKAWFLGSSVPTTSPAAVVVSRTNNANVMYAVCVTVRAEFNTQIVGTPVLLQEDGTLAEQSVDAGAGVLAIRYAGINSGLAAVVDNPGTPGAGNISRGASSTALHDIDFGARLCMVVRETTGGSGSRAVGFSATTSDDRAAVHLAIGNAAAAGGGRTTKNIRQWQLGTGLGMHLGMAGNMV